LVYLAQIQQTIAHTYPRWKLAGSLKQNLNGYWAGFTRKPSRMAWLLSDYGVQWTVLGAEWDASVKATLKRMPDLQKAGRFFIYPSIYFVIAHWPGATRLLPEHARAGIVPVLRDAWAGPVGSPLQNADIFGRQDNHR
jgi:hypothetical protein